MAPRYDGERIVSGSFDKTVRVWDTATWRETLRLTGHRGRVTSVAFNYDGTRIVSGAEENAVYVWDSTTGELLHKLQWVMEHKDREHLDWVASVATNHDGTAVAVGAEGGALCLWAL